MDLLCIVIMKYFQCSLVHTEMNYLGNYGNPVKNFSTAHIAVKSHHWEALHKKHMEGSMRRLSNSSVQERYTYS